MSFFKRKDPNAIPPVATPTPSLTKSPGSYRSSASTYVASRDGDPYSAPYAPSSMSRSSSQTAHTPQDYYAKDAYARRAQGNDAYARGDADIDKDRNELFSGYNPQRTGAGSGRFFDGPQARPAPNTGEETEEDVEGIKQQTRFVKQESVNSTRNALRLAREAEETARNTLTRLGDQSEKLANTERHLDVSKGHALRAEDRTDELKQLNRSIFRPVITWNKDAKRAAQEAKVQARFEEEREEREKAMLDIRDTQNRLGRAATYGRTDDNEEAIPSAQRSARTEQRKRYQFESTASDDELEDELDDNLNEIGDMTKRLKALGSAMGQELDQQIGRIDRISNKTDGLDGKIFRNTERLKRIK